MTRLFLLFVAIVGMTCSLATADDPTRVEIGRVNWQRDYDAAKKHAVESGKPLMMFFQEVPG